MVGVLGCIGLNFFYTHSKVSNCTFRMFCSNGFMHVGQNVWNWSRVLCGLLYPEPDGVLERPLPKEGDLEGGCDAVGDKDMWPKHIFQLEGY